jgi:hypothetical protein
MITFYVLRIVVPKRNHEANMVFILRSDDHEHVYANDIAGRHTGLAGVLGQQPALVGQHGSVHELVELAYRHGFFWGGHFSGRLDGMHFELCNPWD